MKKFTHILILLLVLPIMILLGVGSNESPNNITGSLRRTWKNAGKPTNGTSGTYAGVADAGDLLEDSTNGHLYQNTNTQASPTWSMVRGTKVTTKSASGYLSTADAGVIKATTDSIYLYLPTYVGNTGVSFVIQDLATFTAGVYIYVYSFSGEATALLGDKWLGCTAKYDSLEVICDGTQWLVTSKVGTWA